MSGISSLEHILSVIQWSRVLQKLKNIREINWLFMEPDVSLRCPKESESDEFGPHYVACHY